MKRKRTFVVGRRGRRGTTIVMLRRMASPIAGPWLLQAMVLAG